MPSHCTWEWDSRHSASAFIYHNNNTHVRCAHTAPGTLSVHLRYHSDLNFLTVHGKSRFPGLYIWLRNGSRVAVRIPEGCLLVQAGKQMEHLTGGHVMAGMHEVGGLGGVWVKGLGQLGTSV